MFEVLYASAIVVLNVNIGQIGRIHFEDAPGFELVPVLFFILVQLGQLFFQPESHSYRKVGGWPATLHRLL
jgi:hypothetical protein